jgi:uncharacterized protein YndB with AHSA1/START domain
MEINHQAPLVARKEVFIQATPGVVWKIHTDINAWSQWHPDITMTNLEVPLAVGSVFRWKSGGMTLTSTIQVVEPGRQIGWTGRGLGSKAIHLWTLEPRNGGTLLVTEESLEGWLVRLLKVVTPGFLEESLDTWLQAIKREAES